MAQSDQVIANATFPSVRADINDNLSALYSNSAGASEPSVTTGSMFWVDTTNNCLKMRSEDDSSWYGLYKTDGSQLYASGSTAALPAYSKYDDVNTGLFFPAADVVAISTNATERIRFNSNGNIGVGTTSPARPFSVTDQTSDGTGGIKISSYLPVLEMDDISGGGTSLIIEHNQADTIFKHDSTERIRFLSNGNVGIGTSSASSKLSVVASGSDGNTQQVSRFGISDSTAAYALFIESRVASGNSRQGGVVRAASSLTLEATSFNIDFYAGAAHNTTTDSNLRMRLHSNGKLGFYNSNGEVGSITTSGSSTSYNTSSDYRLKENVKPIADAVSRLMQLKPSRFNFISDKNTVVDGFLAHEAAEVVPEAVTGTKDEMKIIGNLVDQDGKVIQEKVEKPNKIEEGQKWEKTGEEADYQGIDQSKLVPLIVASIQELSKAIQDLKNN